MSTESVSLVVPGRNCASTVRQCLSAVAPLLDGGRLGEIIFVDDGSTDETANIVAEFPVTYVKGSGRGSGAARNLGWREARHPLVWFIDADCVTEPDALVARIVFRRIAEEEPEAKVVEGEEPAEGEEAAEGTPAEDAPSEDA